MIRIATLAVLVFFGLSSLAKADDSTTLRIGAYPFAPFFNVPQEGPVSGLWLDRIERTLFQLGYQTEIGSFPPPRLIKNIIQGRTDITISAHHVAVDDHVFYSKNPVSDIVLHAVHKIGTPAVKHIEDLKGKNVIVIRGYAYNGKIKMLRDPTSDIHIIEAVSHEEALRKLFNGRADYLLDYQNPVKTAIKSMNLSETAFKSSVLSKYSVYFVVSRNSPVAEKLINGIDRMMALQAADRPSQ